jgi:uncharacterized phage protein (TIGR02220 family)
MIVDPDFFEHWRTRTVINALGDDEKAPLYIMRIWAHCQTRRATQFEAMSPQGLRALCRYSGDANVLEQALIDAAFIERDGDTILVPKWAKHNEKLIANWVNGAKGGRPPNEKTFTKSDQKTTQTKPTDKPTQEHGIPSLTDKIREEVNLLSGKPNAASVLKHLNEQTGKNYQTVKANLSLIEARLKEGFTVEQCKAVIDAKFKSWAHDAKMTAYLRPKTLFNATNFAQYAGELNTDSNEVQTWE